MRLRKTKLLYKKQGKAQALREYINFYLSNIMRKSHKQEMLALLGTMGKMANMLPHIAEPYGQVEDCLAACQCLKENLELETAPKSMDLLQLIESSLKDGNLDIFENVKNLEYAFNSEVKTKLEALFLPYKASMWDSLESIYLAAKEDSACDAFVMPIPYYDKKDGKYTQIHWEIDYPKNIPLIDYRKYNIEERHPDMIFVHNPYDGLNTITGVHPDYYSDKLKNLTDCLVYVPYYTQRGSINANARIDDNFIWLPIHFNAHKIITQTEVERNLLVEGFKKYFGFQFGDPEKKFLGLGSPKIDKIVNAKADFFEIPSKWKDLLENSDGTKKRVIFYNTSIAAILNGNEEYLNKLEYVLGEFKKRNNPVLLWRPHPLSVNTFETMRPMLLNRYLNIVEKYKNENYGIYDDSPDLNRAIAISDAYYGDDSSVMTLWGFTGKPLMIQSLDFPFDGIDVQSRLMFASFRMDTQGNAWAWHVLSNGLFKLDIENNKASLVTICDKKEIISQPPYNSIVERDEKLLSFANWGDFIMEFNPKTNEKRYIQLDVKHKTNPIGFAMAPIECDGNYYCFCSYGDSIIVLRKDDSIAYKSEIYKQIGLKAENGIQTKNLVFGLGLDENDKPIFYDDYPAIPIFKWSANMFCIFYETDLIMKYNLETQRMTKILSNKKFANAVQGIYDGKHIWITTRNPLSLLKIDIDKKNVMEFKEFPENFKPSSQELSKQDAFYLVNCDSYLLLFPLFSNMILRFDKNTNSFEQFKGMPIPVDWTVNKPKYGGAFRIGKKVFVLALFNRILYELNIETGDILEHVFECNKPDYEKYFKGNFWHLEPEIKSEQFYAREGNLINAFHEFIDNFPKDVKGQREAFSIQAANSNGTAGKAIYEAVRGVCNPKFQ
jgi:hypothetical protein